MRRVALFAVALFVPAAAAFSWSFGKTDDSLALPPNGQSGLGAFLPWVTGGRADSATTKGAPKAGSSGGRQDLLGPLLARLGLRADPVTLSLLAGLASLAAVFLRRAADSAVASAASALRQVRPVPALR